jgi:hypothetical protein
MKAIKILFFFGLLFVGNLILAETPNICELGDPIEEETSLLDKVIHETRKPTPRKKTPEEQFDSDTYTKPVHFTGSDANDLVGESKENRGILRRSVRKTENPYEVHKDPAFSAASVSKIDPQQLNGRIVEIRTNKGRITTLRLRENPDLKGTFRDDGGVVYKIGDDRDSNPNRLYVRIPGRRDKGEWKALDESAELGDYALDSRGRPAIDPDYRDRQIDKLVKDTNERAVELPKNVLRDDISIAPKASNGRELPEEYYRSGSTRPSRGKSLDDIVDETQDIEREIARKAQGNPSEISGQAKKPDKDYELGKQNIDKVIGETQELSKKPHVKEQDPRLVSQQRDQVISMPTTKPQFTSREQLSGLSPGSLRKSGEELIVEVRKGNRSGEIESTFLRLKPNSSGTFTGSDHKIYKFTGDGYIQFQTRFKDKWGTHIWDYPEFEVFQGWKVRPSE